MSIIKDGRYPIELDRERHLLFSLNAIDEVQDRFGGFDKLGEKLTGKDSIKNLRWLLTLLLNEGADKNDEPLTEKDVGRLIHAGNFIEVKNAIFKAFSFNFKGSLDTDTDEYEDEDDDAEPNEKNM